MSSIGDRLKRRRLERGLNQKVVANVAGVTNAAVSKWEKSGGESMSAVVALRLSQELGVNPFWLVLGEGEPATKVEVKDISETALDLARQVDGLPDEILAAIRTLVTALRPRSGP